MIYLISQIAVSLLLAAGLGGALGWILHRSRNLKRVEQMRQVLLQQSSQLSQAQTDVTMITEDFDELKQKSQTEIDKLKQDTKQIPVLNQNLEKSQLLVRQLMQKHEAKIREITDTNQSLSSQLSAMTDRENAYNKLQAELDLSRREVIALKDQGLSPEASADTHDNDTHSADTHGATNKDIANTDATGLVVNKSSDNESAAQTALDLEAATDQAIDESFDQTVGETADSAEMDSTDARQDADFDQIEPAFADEADPHEVDLSNATAVAESEAAIEEHFEDDDVPEAEQPDTEEPLFEPVEQRDDLKQIFGIGPVTEKALNKLGITSYSQLAGLKRHEIEKIAEALQIFPGRIERDNWVGNARRQLEEVLEEL